MANTTAIIGTIARRVEYVSAEAELTIRFVVARSTARITFFITP